MWQYLELVLNTNFISLKKTIKNPIDFRTMEPEVTIKVRIKQYRLHSSFTRLTSPFDFFRLKYWNDCLYNTTQHSASVTVQNVP